MLETNEKFSRSRKTNHIKEKLLFIKDKCNSKEIIIVDCPAGVMWEVVLTKPLQGTKFRKIRTQLMNCAMEYIDAEESPTKKCKKLIDRAYQKDAIQTVQECVGKYPRSKIGSIIVVNKGILHGIDGRRTKMRTQQKIWGAM